MKPIVLTMQAFGPYAELQTLRFDALGDERLFVITGPTGSGKTTILDAITFALYGTASGSARVPRELRSDYAAPAVPTEVSLTFFQGGRKYRVTRKPEQVILTKRGDKTHTAKAEANLVQLDQVGNETVLATSTSEVTRTVEQLLGLKADQFCQLMVLPQGEFQRFLKADSSQRKAILETLFRMERYKVLEERLRTRAKELEERAAARKKVRDGLLQGAGVAKEEDLAVRLAETEAALKAARKQEEGLRQTREEKAAACTAVQNLLGEFEARDKAARDYGAAEQQDAGMEALRAGVARIQASLELAPVFENTLHAYKDVQAREREQQDTQLQAQRDEAAWTATRKEQQTARQEQQAAQQEQREAFHKAQQEADPAGGDFALENPAGSGLPSFEKWQRELWDKQQKTLRRQAELEVPVQLAGTLREGVPCPVCGATSHPHPATEREEALQESLRKMAERQVLLQALQHAVARCYQADRKLETANQSIQAKEETRKRSAEAEQKAAAALATARREFGAAKQQYERSIADSVFADSKEFQDCYKTRNTLADKQARLEEHTRRKEQLRGILRAASQKVAGKERPDAALVDRVQTEKAAAEAALQECHRNLGRLETRLKTDGETRRSLEKCDRELARLEEEYGPVAKLADTATGQINGAQTGKLSFSAYALQSFLESVLKRANTRLQQISEGRYLLLRSQSISDARKQQGLDLSILDSHTGQKRSAASLSGGETFYTSLSLALGLSDVLLEYAGGLHLDMILVDEGFGTLDPQVLEHALSMLETLQENGRLVGVISHVAELQERIPVQLVVQKTDHGSTASFHVP